jgi:hypothetical protein
MKLREALQDAMLFQEAYEVLLVELDLVKEPKDVQEYLRIG